MYRRRLPTFVGCYKRFVSETAAPAKPGMHSTPAVTSQSKPIVAPPAASVPSPAFKLPVMVQPVSAVHFGDFSVYNDNKTILWIVWDRKGQSQNAIGESFIEGFTKVVEYCLLQSSMGQCKVIVLTSGKSQFCLGADLNSVYPITDKAKLKDVLLQTRDVMRKWAALPVPTVAAINGTALGGGLEVALHCDYRISSSSDSVQLGLPEVKLGVMPGLGGTVITPRLCGVEAALANVLSGKIIRPKQARRIGLVDSVVESVDRYQGEQRFLAAVRTFAGKQVDKRKTQRKRSLRDQFMASTPIGRYLLGYFTVQTLSKSAQNYTAPWKAFESIMYATQKGISFEKAMDKETEIFVDLAASAEAKNLMSIFFLQDNCKKLDRQGSFRKEDIREIDNVGVVGAGVMGSGIAQWLMSKKKKVYLADITEDMLKKGVDFCKKEFEALLKKKRMTQIKFNSTMGLLTSGVDTKPLGQCNVVVEAAVEKMDIKKKMLQQFENDGIITEKNYFATNTSSLSLTELATASKYPKNVVGMHFFNPVKKMPLVEVIRGKQTSDAAVAAIYKLSLDIGKFPIVVGDCPGFLVNRVLGFFMSESLRILEEGAEITRVDKAVLKFGMPMGPFRLLDEVGLDVAAHVAPVLLNGLGNTRFSTSAKVEELVKRGVFGKKTKKGFYIYGEKDKSKGLNNSDLDSVGIKSNSSYNYDDVVDRCILGMVNEACYILHEKIAQSPEDVDLGMVFGTGFAPFRGGLLNYADQRGIAQVEQRLNDLARKYGDRFKPHALLVDMAKQSKKFFPDRPSVSYDDTKKPGNPKYSIW